MVELPADARHAAASKMADAMWMRLWEKVKGARDGWKDAEPSLSMHLMAELGV